MKKSAEYLVLFSILSVTLYTGCGKSGNCLTSTGKIIQEARSVGEFDSIDVRDNVNVILKMDSVNKVVVESGKNIISGITTDVADRQLTIQNLNKCNWLRSYNKPLNVYISAKNLLKINYTSTGTITSSNTLTLYKLGIEVWGGSGTIDLNIALTVGTFILHQGTTDINLHGTCGIANIYTGEYGKFSGKDLKCGYIFITNNGSNDSWVWAWQSLEATISSIGNIYYTGNPPLVTAHITGSGQLIPY